MTAGTRKDAKGRPQLTEHDIQGAVRVLQSLETLVNRPHMVDRLQAKPNQLATLAKRVRLLRDKRKAFLDPYLFGEPAWDILLSLYVARHEGYRMNATSVCNESGVPDTTALRWLESLRELCLIRKLPNPLDARATWVELTDEGAEKIERFLQLAWQDFFPSD